MHHIHPAVGIGLLIVFTGCWSRADPTVARPGSGRQISEMELGAATSGDTVHSFIQRVRPGWLTPRGGQRPPDVFLDNVHLGGIESLRDLQPREIGWIRYLPAPEATLRFGSLLPGAGAILLERRR